MASTGQVPRRGLADQPEESPDNKAMSRQIWVTRDAQGNVVSSTEVRSSSGCAGCLWVLLGTFVVAAPAAWAANGDIPVAAAVAMYVVEASVAAAGLMQYARRRRIGQP